MQLMRATEIDPSEAEWTRVSKSETIRSVFIEKSLQGRKPAPGKGADLHVS
jgi:hypothetical protein